MVFLSIGAVTKQSILFSIICLVAILNERKAISPLCIFDLPKSTLKLELLISKTFNFPFKLSEIDLITFISKSNFRFAK